MFVLQSSLKALLASLFHPPFQAPKGRVKLERLARKRFFSPLLSGGSSLSEGRLPFGNGFRLECCPSPGLIAQLSRRESESSQSGNNTRPTRFPGLVVRLFQKAKCKAKLILVAGLNARIPNGFRSKNVPFRFAGRQYPDRAGDCVNCSLSFHSVDNLLLRVSHRKVAKD